MKHVVIFPTWDCQLRCSYCSIRHSRVDRTVRGVDWQQWAKTLPAALPTGSIVDVAGGEPFLYPGLAHLLDALGSFGLRWAITTNAKASNAIKEFCECKPRGGICINVSDHEGNPEARANKLRMRQAGYQVNVHRVNHPDAGQNHPEAQLITYQDWKGGKAVDGMARECTAGLNHWVAGPSGDLWRCVVALETGQLALGNLFTREVKPTGKACDFGCTSCYTEDPDSWLIEMRELAPCTS